VSAVAERFVVDVAFVHLGDVRFGLTGPLHYSMTGEEGMRLVAAVRPAIAVPVHYEGWSHFHQGRRGVERAVDAAAPDVAARVRFVEIGEPTTLRWPRARPSGPADQRRAPASRRAAIRSGG
jgi:L-ascorbate metabolism protein UlaG (beta-lactamase superfamily)